MTPTATSLRSQGRAHGRPGGLPFSAQAAFADGNWADAALHGRPQDGLAHWAARARCGLAAEALTALGDCPGPEARYQEGVACWLLGDEGRALGLWRPLAEAGDGRAAQLLAWLAPGAPLPVQWLTAAHRGTPGDLLQGLQGDDRFSVLRLTYDALDATKPLPHTLGHPSPIWTGVHMLEWAGLPARVAEQPGKVFAFTSDFDLHLAQLYPAFGAVDALCVLDGTEWAELADLTPTPVLTIPQALGVPALTAPVLPWGERPCGVFLSGTQIHPYHPDKALLAHRVLAHFGAQATGFNGWMSREHYQALLAQAKATYTHYRRPGGTVTRGLEALAMGLGVAVQEESILRLYFGEAEGLLPYRSGEPEDLLRGLERLLARPVAQAEAASARGSAAVARHFGLAKLGAQVGRLLLIQSAELQADRGVVAPEFLVPKRLVLARGWVHPPEHRNAIFDRTVGTLDAWQRQAPPSLRPMIQNQALREMGLRLLDALGVQALNGFPHQAWVETFQAVNQAREVPPALLDLTRSYIAEVRAEHPRHLCLAFNALRLELFLRLRPLEESLAWGSALLEADASSWRVDPLDDPLAWDVWSHGFDYRGWVDTSVALLQGRRQDDGELTKRLLGGVAFHLQEAMGGDWGLLKLAHDLVPEFAPYSLALAQMLTPTEADDSRHMGVQILVELAQGSSVWPIARQRLGRHLLAHPGDAALLQGHRLDLSPHFNTTDLEHPPRF